MTVFQVIQVSYKHPRRYPRFQIESTRLLLASTLQQATDFLQEYIKTPAHTEDVYVFFIRELPVDVPASGHECLSERVYGPAGELIDSRSFSTVWEKPGIFEGRGQEEIRFKPGDIVEVMKLNEVELAFVAGTPTSREEAARINSKGLIKLDVTDDTYTVFLGPDYTSHRHIDALNVFPPRFKIPDRTRRKIENAWRVMKEIR